MVRDGRATVHSIITRYGQHFMNRKNRLKRSNVAFMLYRLNETKLTRKMSFFSEKSQLLDLTSNHTDKVWQNGTRLFRRWKMNVTSWVMIIAWKCITNSWFCIQELGWRKFWNFWIWNGRRTWCTMRSKLINPTAFLCLKLRGRPIRYSGGQKSDRLPYFIL